MAQDGGLSEYDVQIGDAGGEAFPSANTPFRILIIGDFGGRRPLVRRWSPMRVDRDSFPDRLREAQVGLRLTWPDAPDLELSIGRLDDLHPDTLFERLPALARLRALRSRIIDPARAADAAREARALFGLDEPANIAPADRQSASGAEWLAGVIGEAAPRAKDATAATDLDADPLLSVVRRLAREYSVARPPADQQHLVALLDDTASGALRAVMHHPRFQANESAWRGLKLLVDRLELDGNLQCFFVDLARDELDADLAVGPSSSSLHRLVAMPDSGPWAVVSGLYDFGPTERDAAQLLEIARIAEAGGSPFIAAGSALVAGCESFAAHPDPDEWRTDESDPGRQAWASLRARPEATWLALAAPRFLLRMPYGRCADPCAQFDFEETTSPPPHQDYLWGHPALACALVLGQSFCRSGWAMGGSIGHELDGLPLHAYRDAGEPQVTPCAELALRERALDRLLDAGLLVLVSPRGEDRVVVARWQSIATPARTLRGRWT
jgi:type VI secretion system protein ImpC